MKRIFVLGFLGLAACLMMTAGPAQAIDLFDGKVVIHGKISEQLLMRARNTRNYEEYDYRIFNARTTLKLETMWHAYEGEDYELNFYGVWKEFYDAAEQLDGEYKRMLENAAQGTDRARKQARTYNQFKDICRELYMEVNHPNFQVRLGKQVVSWGETAFERMVDNINPIDLRGNLNPAYPDFAELKQGLWMARFFFTPENQPMDMTYELLLIPDFEPTVNFPVGYHNTHPRQFNSFKNGYEMFQVNYRDAPDDSWHKMEFGIRVRGFLAGFDWALSYFHHRSDDPVLKPNKALYEGLGPLLGNTRLGRGLGVYPLKGIKKYLWMDTVGFTFNRPINIRVPIIPFTSLAMTGNILKLEAIWQHNKPGVEALALQGLRSRITQQNRYAFCLGWDTKIFLPYITPWARNKHLGSSTQLFMEFMPEKHRNDYYYPWVTYGKNHKSWTVLTQSFNYELWNGRILPGFYGAWYVNQGGGYWAPAIGFKPQFRHTFLIRYLSYVGLKDSPANVNSKDSLTFEYTYEF